MKKYKNQLQAFLLALVAVSSFYCSESNSSNTDNKTTDSLTVGIDTSIITPPPETSELTRLENELESIKVSVSIKEKEYLGYVGDANAATIVVTSENSSDEEKELAKERADISLQASKKSQSELEELQQKQAEIEEKINTLKNR